MENRGKECRKKEKVNEDDSIRFEWTKGQWVVEE